MLANNFDDLLRQRFEEEEPEYNPAAWTRLAARMEEKKSPKRGIIALWPVTIGIAASVTAAACMLMPTEYPQPRTIDIANLTAVRAVIEKSAPLTTTATELPQLATSPNEASAPFYTPQVMSAPVAIICTKASVSADTVYSTSEFPVKSESAPTVTVVKPRVYASYTQGDDADDISLTPAKRIVISVAGGMQYGSLHAGYAAAINVRHDVGRRWYVDADMGYVQYNASGAQQVTFFNNGGGVAARPAAGIGAKASGTGGDPSVTTPDAVPEALPTFQATQRPRIQYVQATPGLGFRVSTHFTVGASVDIQRALMAKTAEGEPPVQDADGKILPLTDLGAAGRMQWSITNRLKAGLSYRHGLNTTLQGKSNYLDRNYMQLQLIVPLTKK